MIPPDANAGFVAAMEDVLETYQKPRDPDRPLVCLDEILQAIDRRDAHSDPGQARTTRRGTITNTSETA